MIAHGELRGFRRKNPIVVGIEDWKGCFEQRLQFRSFARQNDFRRTDPIQFG